MNQKKEKEQLFLSNYPCNRLRKKELMIRVLKIYYLFIFTILVSCSSEDISQENLDIYIPFPHDSVERISFKSSKILKNQKNFVLIRSGEFQMGSPPNELEEVTMKLYIPFELPSHFGWESLKLLLKNGMKTCGHS